MGRAGSSSSRAKPSERSGPIDHAGPIPQPVTERPWLFARSPNGPAVSRPGRLAEVPSSAPSAVAATLLIVCRRRKCDAQSLSCLLYRGFGHRCPRTVFESPANTSSTLSQGTFGDCALARTFLKKHSQPNLDFTGHTSAPLSDRSAMSPSVAWRLSLRHLASPFPSCLPARVRQNDLLLASPTSGSGGVRQGYR